MYSLVSGLPCPAFLQVESLETKNNAVDVFVSLCAPYYFALNHLCVLPNGPQAFDLTAGGVVVTLPEDRVFDEMEQLVLSTKHLHELLDDFVLRQPTRRVLKVSVVKATAAVCL